MLEVDQVSSGYGMVQILWDVSFTIKDKEIVSIIGPNGAGKTTLVKTVVGLLPARKGTVRFKGENVEKLPPYEIVKRGMALIPEGRDIFPRMTVDENIRLGAYTITDKTNVAQSKARVYNIFPVLKKKEKALAQTLSGGEQQMLVIARSLMASPKLLILDEPSLGLAPIIVEKVLDTLQMINEEGVSILLVEQNIRDSLNISNRAYVLEEGKIIIEGEGRTLLNNEHIKQVYLGI
jgi:branched-chain amino acid transport system ATP-binding protein